MSELTIAEDTYIKVEKKRGRPLKAPEEKKVQNVKEYRNIWNANNRKKQHEYYMRWAENSGQKEKILCETCNEEITKHSLKKHLKSKLHIEGLTKKREEYLVCEYCNSKTKFKCNCKLIENLKIKLDKKIKRFLAIQYNETNNKDSTD